MHSYTSNIKKENISEKKYNFALKTAVSFVIIFGIYFLITCIAPKSDDGPGLYFTNVLKAQRFAMRTEDANVILVGSSMASVVHIEDYADDYVNLAFSGGDALTGLELIKRKTEKTGDYPEVIFIEISDAMINGIDEDILEKTNGFGLSWINRIENRPDYIFYSIAKAIYYKNREKMITDYGVVEEKLIYWREVKSVPVNQNDMNEYMELAKEYADYFMEKGCRVVLLEMPYDASLHDLPETVQVRETALSYMPADEYEWFITDWSEYIVSDAIHMGKLSADRYANRLIETYLQ